MLRVSHDGGTGFGPVQRVSAAGMQARFPAIAVGDSVLTLVWSEDRDPFAVQAGATHASARHGLPPVGDAHVLVREARFR